LGPTDAMTGPGHRCLRYFARRNRSLDKVRYLAQRVEGTRCQEMGAIARPRQIMVVNELPKTRSGKIMRRLLRDVAENRAVGDSTTLAVSKCQ
jgi:acetyl-CoA synthetase